MAEENAGASDATSTATVPTDGSVVTGAAQPADAGAAGDKDKAADPAAGGTKEGGDTKPADQKATDEKGEKGEGDKKPEADKPIEYAAFTLPEGVQVDEKALGEFTAISQEAKVPQEVAQKYVDLYAGKLKAATEAIYQGWHDTQSKWVKEINEDPEVGGDKLKDATSNAARALDHPALKIPGLREALIFTGAGNHPAVLKFFARVGKAVSADGTFIAGNPTNTPSFAEQMYPTMRPKE